MAFKAWSKRIEAAEKRGHFTARDKDDASDWPTCAIGELHDWPDDEDFRPDDADEDRLGMEFLRGVELDNIAKAKAVYAKIQVLA